MNDMSPVIVAKSDQWNADDFAAGPRTFTIEDVSIKPGTEQPVQIKLAGSDKVFRPCKTVSRILVAAWGADANVYRGRSLTLFTDPGVTWGGMKVGGIRVSHMSDITAPLVIALQEKKGSRKMTTVQPLKVDAKRGAIDQARDAIAGAIDIADLDRIWRLPAMRPFRETLLEEQRARRTELTTNDGTLSADNTTANEGRPDSDMGEPDDTSTIIAMYERATTPADIAAADKAAAVLALSDADIDAARNDAEARVA